jgi:N-methylhydantoinase B/oxoprolinase/acetone carboxylase alpha subunit
LYDMKIDPHERVNLFGQSGYDEQTKTMSAKLRRGDVFSMWTQGGGGYGPPEERDPAAIERDLREEKTTPQRSREAYGDKGTKR